MEALIGRYARQIFHEKSDTSGTERLVDACKIAVRALDGLQAKKRVTSCICSPQMFPSHAMHFLLNTIVDPSSFERGSQILLNQWLSTWRTRFCQMKVDMLLAVKHCAIE